MSSNKARNKRTIVAIGVAILAVLFFLGFFALELAAVMGLKVVILTTDEVMLLGFMMWLYVIYQRIKDAQEKAFYSATTADLLVDIVCVIFAVISGLGLIFPNMQTAACLANIIIAFFMLVLRGMSGVATIKHAIALSKLK